MAWDCAHGCHLGWGGLLGGSFGPSGGVHADAIWTVCFISWLYPPWQEGRVIVAFLPPLEPLDLSGICPVWTQNCGGYSLGGFLCFWGEQHISGDCSVIGSSTTISPTKGDMVLF